MKNQKGEGKREKIQQERLLESFLHYMKTQKINMKNNTSKESQNPSELIQLVSMMMLNYCVNNEVKRSSHFSDI